MSDFECNPIGTAARAASKIMSVEPSEAALAAGQRVLLLNSDDTMTGELMSEIYLAMKSLDPDFRRASTQDEVERLKAMTTVAVQETVTQAAEILRLEAALAAMSPSHSGEVGQKRFRGLFAGLPASVFAAIGQAAEDAMLSELGAVEIGMAAWEAYRTKALAGLRNSTDGETLPPD